MAEGLFSPLTVRSLTLRNRIGISPMSQYACTDGFANDWHVVHLGARAAGGAGLVMMESAAVVPEGRHTYRDLGIWTDQHVEPLRRVASFIEAMGAVPALQLGHSGRRGSAYIPWEGNGQYPSSDPRGFRVVAPSAIPYGTYSDAPGVMTVADIEQTCTKFAKAADRAVQAGFKWIEMHYAHGFLGAQFLSPIANKRGDQYGGSAVNRRRFLMEAFHAVRSAVPDSLPVTMRLGVSDFTPDSHSFEESLEVVRVLMDDGLDAVDLSVAGNDRSEFYPWSEEGFMVPHARATRETLGITTQISWNLGDPEYADRVIRNGSTDLIMIGRPALGNAAWPYYAAQKLNRAAPTDLLPKQYEFWLEKYTGRPWVNGFEESADTQPGARAP